jgi:hypothetical protein
MSGGAIRGIGEKFEANPFRKELGRSMRRDRRRIQKLFFGSRSSTETFLHAEVFPKKL